MQPLEQIAGNQSAMTLMVETNQSFLIRLCCKTDNMLEEFYCLVRKQHSTHSVMFSILWNTVDMNACICMVQKPLTSSE